MVSLIVNSAHPESLYTCLAFSQDGSKLYTGGEEGYVRIWKSELGSEQEPDVALEGKEAITSIATSKTCWLSGSLDACVRTYEPHGSTMEGLVTRATAVPVRCVAIDPKGERVAVTSDELEVKVIALNEITNIKKLEGHRKGVRRATWNPSGTILTTCGSDGDIIVWDMSFGEEPKRLETIEGIIPSVDAESPDYLHDCSAIWHHSGKYFVVASRAHELVAISRDRWQKSFTFSDDTITGAITALALSPNGTYLASATFAGIIIWSTATRSVLFRYIPSTSFALVSHIAFSPTQNLLAWTDADGTLSRWPDPIPPTSPDPVRVTTASSSVGITLKKGGDLFSFDDNDEESKQKLVKGLADTTRDEDYGMDDDDWIIDDIGLLGQPDKEKDKDHEGYAREMVSVTKAQPAFQPASTPMANKRRYLAYNMIGVIEVTDQDSHHIVNVDFHDRSTRAGSHFQDEKKCDLASLGERGAAYACQPESGHPAQIMYKPYSGWAASGEWSLTLPIDETVIALAAGGTPPSRSLRNKLSEGDIEGNGNVVVVTSRGYLRFFTGGGVQRYVWGLGADVVTMVAGREWVFVVHRDGGASLDGCQNLSYTLIALDTFTTVQHGRLPLPKGSLLKWIGISEEGAPAMYDSNGLLSILDRFRRPSQARWVPILDTTTLTRRQGKDESYWPVGVSGTLFMCIILKGREEYPGFPRPLIQELEVQMPLLNLDVPQGQMEERFLREEIHLGFLRDALGSDLTSQEISQLEVNLDKELIQLIQLACKSDKQQRALDAVALLHHIQSFDSATKVVEFYRLIGLHDKITALKKERMETDRLEEEKEHRKNLGKHFAPIAAPRNHGQESSHRRFEDFGPPQVTIPKSLAPAKPVINSTRAGRDDHLGAGFSSGWGTRDIAASVASMRAEATDPSPWDKSFEGDASLTCSTGDGKRKRDSLEMTEFDDSPAGAASKKRALQPLDTPESITTNSSKSLSNPFARKPQDTKNNPFARPGTSKPPKLATKSNSFFDKVDEANEVATQAKTTLTKPPKDTRQTTLFGLPPGPRPERKGRSSKASKGGTQQRSQTETQTETQTGTQTEIQTETQTEMQTEPQTETQETLNSFSINEANDDFVDPSAVNVAQGVQDSPDHLDAEETSNSPPEIEWPPSPPPGQQNDSLPEFTISQES